MRLKQYITEATGKIYFGHPGPTYNTPLEKKAISVIKEKFPGKTIINPNNPANEKKYKEIGFDVFFDLIDTCDFGVFMTAPDGRWGVGIYEEAYYCQQTNKKVYELNPQTWEFKIIKNPKATKYHALGLTKKGEVKRRIP